MMIDCVNHINPNKAYVNEYKDMGGGVVAHRYNMCGSDEIVYAAYEMTTLSGGYHTYASCPEQFPGVWLGDITCTSISAEIDALPPGQERINAVEEWYRVNADRALSIVMQAFPADFSAEGANV